jgi:DUF1365 family protein
MESCIYEGTVAHRRRSPVEHRFRYSMFMMYLDLDELPTLLRKYPWLSSMRFAPASFLRTDHFGDPQVPLDQSVRALVTAETGLRPTGPIRVLTQLRYWGCYFSPLNLFYGFDDSGRQVDWIVAEVSNTPWNQKHCYVLWDGNRVGGGPSGGQLTHYRHGKTFHVSPFMGMNSEYDWRLGRPQAQLNVSLKTLRDGDRFFQATMSLKRRELTNAAFAATLVKYPVMTAKIVGAIYFEALRLRLKKVPFYTHPDKMNPSPVLPQPATQIADSR